MQDQFKRDHWVKCPYCVGGVYIQDTPTVYYMKREGEKMERYYYEN